MGNVSHHRHHSRYGHQQSGPGDREPRPGVVAAEHRPHPIHRNGQPVSAGALWVLRQQARAGVALPDAHPGRCQYLRGLSTLRRIHRRCDGDRRLDQVLRQQLPLCDQPEGSSGVIEVTNTTASYSGGAPPNGFTVIPQFVIVTGSTPNLLICDQISPNPLGIPSGGAFDDASVVFNGGAGATLQGQYSIVGNNGLFTDGHGVNHASISLFSPLPQAPTPGVDTFYVTGTVPSFG